MSKRSQYLRYVSKKQPRNSATRINSNKKKIRNWPVLVKRLSKMKKQYLFNDAQMLKQCLINNGRSLYMKLQIDPFNRFKKRNPPLWYKKLFIDALMEVYSNWKNLADDFSEDYYLKIWVFEPNFYDSQVVLGIRERIVWYQDLFDDYDENIDFPHEKYSNMETACDTRKINWEIKKSVIPYTEDDLTYLPKKIIKNKINNGKAWTVDDKFNGKLTIIHESDVWLGCT